jgi:hypothetical protein
MCLIPITDLRLAYAKARIAEMTERKASTVILIGTLIIIALCIIFGTIYGAKAHQASSGMQYDQACCADHDCHPVPDGVVDDSPDGGIEVKGYGHIPKGDSRIHDSQDTEDHLCIQKENGWGSSGKLNCVYHVHRGF